VVDMLNFVVVAVAQIVVVALFVVVVVVAPIVVVVAVGIVRSRNQATEFVCVGNTRASDPYDCLNSYLHEQR
jgi:hypothetical protein